MSRRRSRELITEAHVPGPRAAQNYGVPAAPDNGQAHVPPTAPPRWKFAVVVWLTIYPSLTLSCGLPGQPLRTGRLCSALLRLPRSWCRGWSFSCCRFSNGSCRRGCSPRGIAEPRRGRRGSGARPPAKGESGDGEQRRILQTCSDFCPKTHAFSLAPSRVRLGAEARGT